MKNRIKILLIIFLLCIYVGCSQPERVEIKTKREFTTPQSNNSVTPLPVPQRLRLVPLVPNDIDSVSNQSEESQLANPQSQIPQKVEEALDGNEGANTPNSVVGGFAQLNLIWQTPDGWQEDRGKPMRIVTFTGGEGSSWECYISVLTAQAGGVEANFNRWASQMGKTDIDVQFISQLPEINIMGKSCKVLDINGDYIDMQGNTFENYRLLGTVCPLENHTLFIKMTGTDQEIAQQKENFFKLCKSLSLAN